MKTRRIIKAKITKPNKGKKRRLNNTIRQYRRCLNHSIHELHKGETQKEVYHGCKEIYNLPTYLIATCITVAREKLRTYEQSEDIPFPHYDMFIPVRYSNQSMSFKKTPNKHYKRWVSLLVIKEEEDKNHKYRVNVPIQGYDLHYLDEKSIKAAQLFRKEDDYYINLQFVEEHDIPSEEDFEHFVGVDLGIKNIATMSVLNKKGDVLKSKFFNGNLLIQKREHYRRLKARLQEKGAYETLKRIKHKEKDYMRDINHKISTEIINIASEYENTVIVLERLNFKRKRFKRSKEWNDKFFRWSYGQLREFITYKAHKQEIAIRTVNPMYTSQVCTNCLSRTKSFGQQEVCEKCKKDVNHDWLATVNLVKRLWGYMSHNTGGFDSRPEHSSGDCDEGTVAEPAENIPFGERKGFCASLEHELTVNETIGVKE